MTRRFGRSKSASSMPASGSVIMEEDDSIGHSEFERSHVSDLNDPPHAMSCTRTEAKMRRQIKYFFMTPCEKYKAKGRIPYKLLMQLAKIVFITIQLVEFGYNSSSHVTFSEKNTVAFRHLFLEGWEASYETMPYPPSHGPFAVYTYEEFYSKINYAMARYNETLKIALGSYDYAHPNSRNMSLCKKYYREGHIFASNQTYIFDSQEDYSCILLEPVAKTNATTNETVMVYDAKQFLEENNMTINLDRVIKVWLNFSLKSIQLKAFDYDQSPDCFRFLIEILFDNSEHNGQIVVSLDATMHELPCKGTVARPMNVYHVMRGLVMFMDVTVIILSFLSCILCVRSHVKSWKLLKKTQKFFRLQYRLDLKQDRWEFLNLWYVLIMINDVMVIFGSIYKIQLDNKSVCLRDSQQRLDCSYWKRSARSSEAVDDYNICSFMLGLGSLFVWLGVLRYLGFSYKNNILILTLKKAMPAVLRFVACALIIFLAFALSAWVVLGPYHIKFRTIFSTFECLFSLVNGDDMYTTFSVVTAKNGFIFYFSRIFLYIFISLFIYVVLNLFITIIIEAYEEVKSLQKFKGRPDTPLWQFVRRCNEDARSTLFLSDDVEDAFIKPPGRLASALRRLNVLFCGCFGCCEDAETKLLRKLGNIQDTNGPSIEIDSNEENQADERTHLLP